MVAFTEERFNTEIRYGTVGGPEFSTDVLTVTSGQEQRNANWKDSRGRWTIGDDVLNKKQMDWLIAFFRGRKGRAGGFRFKDWSDWECKINKAEGYIEGTVLYEPGTQTYRLAKEYRTAEGTTTRAIVKPVEGTIKWWQPYDTPVVDLVTGKLVYGEQVDGPGIDYLTGITGNTALRWTGEFDVPARFDVDTFDATFEGYRGGDGESLYTVSGVTIVELNLLPIQPVIIDTTAPATGAA